MNNTRKTHCKILKSLVFSCIIIIAQSKSIPSGNGTEQNIYGTIKIPKHVWKLFASPKKDIYVKGYREPVELVVPIVVNSEETNDNIPVVVQDEPETPISDPIVEEILPPPAPVEPEVVMQTVRYPCSCKSGQCGCCTGLFLERYNQKGCANISFLKEEFVFDMRMTYNNNTVLRRKVSVSDPPPVCFNPRRLPFVEVCVSFSNIHIRAGNAHVCIDIDANIGGMHIFSRSFDCFSLGNGGLQSGLDPDPIRASEGPPAIDLFSNSEQSEGGGFGELLGNPVQGLLSGIGDQNNGGSIFDPPDSDNDGGFGDGPLADAADLFDGLK